MIFTCIAPTSLGLLLAPFDKPPEVQCPDDCSLYDLMKTVSDQYHGADFQLLIPVGTFVIPNGVVRRIIGVGEVYNKGQLRSCRPDCNSLDLLTALVRGGCAGWRLEAKDENDFSIKFLGS